jgi:transcriptional regulator with XRE-family HTH domain
MGLTVEEISTRCEVASATWSTWERGTLPRDVADVCIRIAKATGYDLHWLVFGGVTEGAHNPRYVNVTGVTTPVGQMELPLLDRIAPGLELVNA